MFLPIKGSVNGCAVGDGVEGGAENGVQIDLIPIIPVTTMTSKAIPRYFAALCLEDLSDIFEIPTKTYFSFDFKYMLKEAVFHNGDRISYLDGQ